MDAVTVSTQVKLIKSIWFQVMSHSSVNKMTSMNLAIVFGPNLMWSKSQAASLDAMAQVNSFTLLLLENIRFFFETGWLEMIQSF